MITHTLYPSLKRNNGEKRNPDDFGTSIPSHQPQYACTTKGMSQLISFWSNIFYKKNKKQTNCLQASSIHESPLLPPTLPKTLVKFSNCATALLLDPFSRWGAPNSTTPKSFTFGSSLSKNRWKRTRPLLPFLLLLGI